MKIIKTPFYSKRIGKIADGCNFCVKGEKLVLFVTGLCSRNCWYCPLAETKKGKDVLFANEWLNPRDEDIIKEAELCSAKGAGITGGDPFLRIERTAHYIRLLKNKFGKKFHIHLYAPLELIDSEKLKKLHSSGLDEIRIHPDFNFRSNWNKIDLISKFKWDIGMEIPVIPGIENITKEMIDYFSDKIIFLNINELEASDMNVDDMIKKGFKTKDELSYAIKGSGEMAAELMKYILKKKYKFSVHYCTSKLKDRVQLANRIKRRAKNIAEKFDIITDEGMLFRGAVYLNELKPGFGYRKMLEKIDNNKKEEIIRSLEKIKNNVIKKFEFNKNLLKIDYKKLRILANIDFIEKNKKYLKQMKLIPAIVEEYPTWDMTEVNVKFL